MKIEYVIPQTVEGTINPHLEKDEVSDESLHDHEFLSEEETSEEPGEYEVSFVNFLFCLFSN